MIHLITYGNNIFERAKKRLYKEAKESKWFDTITLYGPKDLDNEFKKRFKNILNKRRGGGYWIWKSHIIKKKLSEINENDILIYLDAGCSINKKGKKRFDEYINILNNSDKGIISFYMGHIEKYWTTKEIFNYFNVHNDNKIINTGQIIGGIRIMKKNKNLIHLINLESKTLYDNPLLFTDHYNKNQNSYFKDNRHEQSVFSVIRKMSNPILLNDETYFKPFGNEDSLKYPFWATRKRY
jgi:hypothetical protein